jgi:hypothetical protein
VSRGQYGHTYIWGTVMLLKALTASLAFSAMLTLSACGPAGVNGSVEVPAGATSDSATTVNGAVNVGDGAKIGKAATVNGAIHLGQNVTAESAKTVNGGIEIGGSTRVANDVIAVNGGIRLAKDSDVSGRVTNVNGAIKLEGAHVGGGITTFNGDILVGADSRVEGGIRVEKPEFMNEQMSIPTVTIGPRAVVDGTLKFERSVKLYVSESAKIGPVEGATPTMFSGESPESGGASSAAADSPSAPPVAESASSGPATAGQPER